MHWVLRGTHLLRFQSSKVCRGGQGDLVAENQILRLQGVFGGGRGGGMLGKPTLTLSHREEPGNPDTEEENLFF